MPIGRSIRSMTAVAAVVLVVVIALALGGHWIYNVADLSSGPMLIAGRRGDIAQWPENTLPGVLSAAAQGADGIEMDVRRSADGTFFLIHDATVDRTTDGTGEMAAMTDEEVGNLGIDGGMGFVGQSDLLVPTLADVLAALQDYPGLLLLDLKGAPADHADLAALVADEHAWIGCGSEDDVRAIGKRVETYGPEGIGADHVIKDSPLALGAFFDRADVSPIYWWWKGSETDVMDRARRWGVQVYITNDLAEALAWSSDR